MTMKILIPSIAVCTLFTPIASAGDTTLTALLREGDVLKAGEVTSINSATANHVGGYAVGATIGGVPSIWGNTTGGAGDVLRQIATIGNLQQNSFESFIGMADDGTLAYSPSCTNLDTGADGLDSVWFGDSVMWIEEQAAPDFPGNWFSFGSRPGATSTAPYGIAGITDTQGGSTDFRALMLGDPSSPLIAGGDIVTGLPLPIAQGSSVDFDARVSGDGAHWLTPVALDSGSSSNDGAIVTHDGGLILGGTLVREANLIPASVGGLPGEAWDNFDFMGVNNNGDIMFTGDTDASTTIDEFVVINGSIVLREGMSVDGYPLSGSIEAGSMNNNGDWAVVWDIDVDGNNVEALIVNGSVVAIEGDEVDFDGDGNPDPGVTLDNFTGISGMVVGANDGSGFNVYGTVDADDGIELLEMLYCVRFNTGTTCPCDFDSSGVVDVNDLLFLLAGWGTSAGDCNGDGDTNVDDLLDLLAAWGDC